MKKSEKKIRSTNLLFIIVFAVLLLYVVSLIVPMCWALLTSLKSRGDYIMNTMGLPKKIMWENYKVAVQFFRIKFDTHTVGIDVMIVNSIVYAIGSALFLTFGNCVTAYCCSKFSKFKISNVYTTIVIVAMALPIVGSEPSALQMKMALGLYDSVLGVVICQFKFLGLYYLVFFAAFKSIPNDYSEAAYLDGANNFILFFKLMLPFVSKMFLTVTLIHFIIYWNDYQIPLLYLPSHPTLAYGLFKYSSSYEREISSTPMKMAGCMVLFLPIFVVFCIFQKRLIGNIMVGGVKE